MVLNLGFDESVLEANFASEWAAHFASRERALVFERLYRAPCIAKLEARHQLPAASAGSPAGRDAARPEPWQVSRT